MSDLNNTILACVDGSKSSEAVCDYASWLALATDTELKLLHTIAHSNMPSSADLSGSIGLGAKSELLNELATLERQRSKLLLESGRTLLEASKHRASEQGVSRVSTIQRHGDLSETLIELEPETRALVLGIRGESHQDSEEGIGHKLESVLRGLRRPMLVVNQPFAKPKSIMLAYDGGESATKALQMVASSPVFKGMTCHVVYAGEGVLGEKALAHAEQVLLDSGVDVMTHQVEGDLGRQIVSLQNEYVVDMTVMGAYSHGRLRDFIFGSLTTEVLKNSAKPLLFLR